jgi:hypothetical protein
MHSRTVLLALGLALATGSILALSPLFDLPELLVLLAGLGFLLSALTVGVISARRAREDGVSFPRAVDRGAKTVLQWLWELLP